MMPPKGMKPEELVEAILDPKAVEAIAKALSPYIMKAIDTCLTDKLSGLLGQINVLKAENKALKAELAVQSERIGDMETHTRGNNVIIRGLPEVSSTERMSGSPSSSPTGTARPTTSYLDTNKAVETNVILFCRDSLHIDVSPQDISIAHLIKAGKKDTARPVIVSFTSRRVRNEVYYPRKRLKASKSTVFISEHLSKTAADLFYDDARRLLSDKKIFGTWTQNGQVYVKFSSDPAVRGELVRVKSDLNLRP